MYYVYILQSQKDNKKYVGFSNDVRRRLEEQNFGKVEATRYRRPFKLIYFEGYLEQEDATRREKYFKTQWGRTHLRKILKTYMDKSKD